MTPEQVLGWFIVATDAAAATAVAAAGRLAQLHWENSQYNKRVGVMLLPKYPRVGDTVQHYMHMGKHRFEKKEGEHFSGKVYKVVGYTAGMNHRFKIEERDVPEQGAVVQQVLQEFKYDELLIVPPDAEGMESNVVLEARKRLQCSLHRMRREGLQPAPGDDSEVVGADDDGGGDGDGRGGRGAAEAPPAAVAGTWQLRMWRQTEPALAPVWRRQMLA
ncbi:hypothetical protein VOLCADRAFT_87239 [Volvox carteri f. nagariensis]|uniref:Uncharacterized protein n=1 Tax=Volvox carteri f. nagariensis TaxID=3068 RepID=D8TKI5_VOLCA|nr:uncharacterized protein VOLCADRAFT_87239 [Volvox carteri f. nagariensis]EFJ52251.1 hypothetical protein VOLCADRAFT_87239 [Volvox carteri f. nagariensis]|eukprot:XP_002947025.1 hypothetical protein VOLCADRAFT_87239 [Volvox carteri f. nagariensis]